jgi:hypothetical protein
MFAHWFQADPESVDLRASGGFSATTYFQNKADTLAIFDEYFGQRTYQVYAESAKLVNRDWDNLPFASHLTSLYADTILPQLRARGRSADALMSWQQDLTDYAIAQGYAVDD